MRKNILWEDESMGFRPGATSKKRCQRNKTLLTKENYFGRFENDKKREASDVINEFKAIYSNEETVWRSALVSKLNTQIERLKPEQIQKVLGFINEVIKEQKAV